MLGGAKEANILRDEAIVINVDDIRRHCFADLFDLFSGRCDLSMRFLTICLLLLSTETVNQRREQRRLPTSPPSTSTQTISAPRPKSKHSTTTNPSGQMSSTLSKTASSPMSSSTTKTGGGGTAETSDNTGKSISTVSKYLTLATMGRFAHMTAFDLRMNSIQLQVTPRTSFTPWTQQGSLS